LVEIHQLAYEVYGLGMYLLMIEYLSYAFSSLDPEIVDRTANIFEASQFYQASLQELIYQKERENFLIEDGEHQDDSILPLKMTLILLQMTEILYFDPTIQGSSFLNIFGLISTLQVLILLLFIILPHLLLISLT